jgi:hypothetical protein
LSARRVPCLRTLVPRTAARRVRGVGHLNPTPLSREPLFAAYTGTPSRAGSGGPDETSHPRPCSRVADPPRPRRAGSGWESRTTSCPRSAGGRARTDALVRFCSLGSLRTLNPPVAGSTPAALIGKSSPYDHPRGRISCPAATTGQPIGRISEPPEALDGFCTPWELGCFAGASCSEAAGPAPQAGGDTRCSPLKR